jgi:hypothetical protein
MTSAELPTESVVNTMWSHILCNLKSVHRFTVEYHSRGGWPDTATYHVSS